MDNHHAALRAMAQKDARIKVLEDAIRKETADHKPSVATGLPCKCFLCKALNENESIVENPCPGCGMALEKCDALTGPCCASCRKDVLQGGRIAMVDDQPITAFPFKCAKCGATVRKNGRCPGDCGYSY